MKIVRGNYVYIELFEYKFLLNNLNHLPDEVKNEIFCGRDTIILDEKIDEREFICIEGENLIKFLNNLEYFIDYDKVKKLDYISVCELYNDLHDELDKLKEELNDNSKFKSIETLNRILNKLNQIELRCESLKHYLHFLEGRIKLFLPDGIDYPRDYCKVRSKFIK